MRISDFSLFIFDMDGTLTENPSSWQYVHDRLGINNHNAFNLYRKGMISYYDFFINDIRAWLSRYPRINRRDVQSLLDEIPLRKGLRDMSEIIHDNGIIQVIVSGGISWLADRIGKEGYFDEIHSNMIGTLADGTIIPEGDAEVDPARKDRIIRMVQEKYGISEKQTVSVGDEYENGSIHARSALSIIISRHPPKNSDAKIRIRCNNLYGIIDKIKKL